MPVAIVLTECPGYRPPSHQQIEWTFPIQYKSLEFDDPLPETRALMDLIAEVRPDFIYSLHNSGFGGVYFYVSEDAESLYRPFYDLVESQGLGEFSLKIGLIGFAPELGLLLW